MGVSKSIPNIVERAIRPQTITRKNALLARTRRRRSNLGGHRHALADRKNERSRSTGLAHADLYERIAQGWPISQIDQLMPWNFKASTASA